MTNLKDFDFNSYIETLFQLGDVVAEDFDIEDPSFVGKYSAEFVKVLGLGGLLSKKSKRKKIGLSSLKNSQLKDHIR